jgi:hypothetical protein
MTFLVLFAAAIFLIGFAFVRTHLKSSRLSRLSWEELVSMLEPLPADGIASVAIEYLHPAKGQIGIETDQLWTLIGGADGLQRMRSNADILIALAGYAQRWNFNESVIVAERMRRDALLLKRATFRLGLDLALGQGKIRGAFNVQEAASAYYLMRQRLLALYETSHVGRYSYLAAAA